MEINEIFESLGENLNADLTEKLLIIKTTVEDLQKEIVNEKEKITNLENSLLVKSNELTKYEKIIADYIKTGVKNEDTITENNTLSEIDEFNQEIGL